MAWINSRVARGNVERCKGACLSQSNAQDCSFWLFSSCTVVPMEAAAMSRRAFRWLEPPGPGFCLCRCRFCFSYSRKHDGDYFKGTHSRQVSRNIIILFTIFKKFVSNNEDVGGSASDKKARLKRIDDMPPYLQFNPYIHTGYREMLNTKDSVFSLFYFHNETVNILTHGKNFLGLIEFSLQVVC